MNKKRFFLLLIATFMFLSALPSSVVTATTPVGVALPDAEIQMLYDAVQHNIHVDYAVLGDIFTDLSFSALNADVTLDEIYAAIEYAEDDATIEILEDAIQLYNEPASLDNRTFTLAQPGSMATEQARTRIAIQIMAKDITGFYALPNETLTINVDTAPGDPLPFLRLGQVGQLRGGRLIGLGDARLWLRDIPLVRGNNTIVLPDWGTAGGLAENDFGPAAIYFVNPFYPNQQQRPPVVRLTGGHRYPVYFHGVTDPVAFQAEVTAFANNAIPTGQEFNNRTSFPARNYNIAAVVSDGIHNTTTATAMRDELASNPAGRTIAHTMDRWDYWYEEMIKFSGFDFDPNSFDFRPNGRFVGRVHNFNGSIGYANPVGPNGGYQGYNGIMSSGRHYRDIVSYNTFDNHILYLFTHEMGHMIENADMRWIEITTDLYIALGFDLFGFHTNSSGDNTEPMRNYHLTGQYPQRDDTFDRGLNAAIMYQMHQMYGFDLYANAVRVIRRNPDMFTNIPSGENSRNFDRRIAAMSLGLGMDISGHMNYFRRPLSATVRNQTGVNLLPVADPARRTWYAHTSRTGIRQPRQRFSSPNISPTVTATVVANGVQLAMSLPSEHPDSFLCFEVRRQGTARPIAVSHGSGNNTNVTFIDTAGNTNSVYTITAYDRHGFPSESVTARVGQVFVDAQTPNITTQPTNVTVNVGGTAALTVAANVTDGGTLSFQWFSNTTNSNSGGTAISGATSATFNAPTTVAGTRHYYVVVTNTNNSATGSTTAIRASNAASVTILGPPVRFGDVNDDGVINAADVTLLRRYIAASDKTAFLNANLTFTLAAADVNNNGIIDHNDVSLLRLHIAATNPTTVPLG